MHMQKEETTGDHQEFDEMYRRTQAEIYKFIRYRVTEGDRQGTGKGCPARNVLCCV